MNSSKIIYRICTPQDISSIITLIYCVRGDDRLLEHNQFIIACDKDKIVGCVRTVQAEFDCKELASLVVLPEYRNQGIGTTLVNKILQKDFYRPLYLICFRNKASFYKRHNFHIADILSLPQTLQRDYKSMTEKKCLDLVAMVLKK